jgi:hypothetical protein
MQVCIYANASAVVEGRSKLVVFVEKLGSCSAVSEHACVRELTCVHALPQLPLCLKYLMYVCHDRCERACVYMRACVYVHARMRACTRLPPAYARLVTRAYPHTSRVCVHAHARHPHTLV